MKGLTLSLVALTALGFTEHLKDGDEARLSTAVNDMAAKLTAEQTAHAELKRKYEQLSLGQGKALVDAAILSGKITEADRADYEALTKTNYELAAKTLNRMPGATSLGGQVSNPANGSGPKTADEFEKLSTADQIAFKNANPAAYKKLFA